MFLKTYLIGKVEPMHSTLPGMFKFWIGSLEKFNIIDNC